jgi:hypothetical protein
MRSSSEWLLLSMTVESHVLLSTDNHGQPLMGSRDPEWLKENEVPHIILVKGMRKWDGLVRGCTRFWSPHKSTEVHQTCTTRNAGFLNIL